MPETIIELVDDAADLSPHDMTMSGRFVLRYDADAVTLRPYGVEADSIVIPWHRIHSVRRRG